jgi:hypothetical protein
VKDWKLWKIQTHFCPNKAQIDMIAKRKIRILPIPDYRAGLYLVRRHSQSATVPVSCAMLFSLTYYIEACKCKSNSICTSLFLNSSIWHKPRSVQGKADTGKPSSLRISLVACRSPVYLEGPYTSLRRMPHEVVGSN